MDGPVAESVLAQEGHIRFRHRLRSPGKFSSICAQSHIRGVQMSLRPIIDQLVHELVGFVAIYKTKIGDLSPELVSMISQSIKTAVLGRDDHG